MLKVLFFASIVFWTARGFVGTYGGYTLEKPGYGIHWSISVGSHSDHDEEARLYKVKAEAAKKSLAALAPEAQKVFDHFMSAKHPYQVDAEVFDRARTKELKDDYKYRHQMSRLNGNYIGTGLSLYLYFKPELRKRSRISAFVRRWRTSFSLNMHRVVICMATNQLRQSF